MLRVLALATKDLCDFYSALDFGYVFGMRDRKGKIVSYSSRD